MAPKRRPQQIDAEDDDWVDQDFVTGSQCGASEDEANGSDAERKAHRSLFDGDDGDDSDDGLCCDTDEDFPPIGAKNSRCSKGMIKKLKDANCRVGRDRRLKDHGDNGVMKKTKKKTVCSGVRKSRSMISTAAAMSESARLLEQQMDQMEWERLARVVKPERSLWSKICQWVEVSKKSLAEAPNPVLARCYTRFGGLSLGYYKSAIRDCVGRNSQLSAVMDEIDRECPADIRRMFCWCLQLRRVQSVTVRELNQVRLWQQCRYMAMGNGLHAILWPANATCVDWSSNSDNACGHYRLLKELILLCSKHTH
jgi:hypothetical protein